MDSRRLIWTHMNSHGLIWTHMDSLAVESHGLKIDSKLTHVDSYGLIENGLKWTHMDS